MQERHAGRTAGSGPDDAVLRPSSERPDGVSLDEVITTEELRRRRSRPPDHEAENRALRSLLREMARPEGDVLRELVAEARALCGADSAGVSILEEEDGDEVFRWHAVAGAWSRFLGDTMPRAASPCGTVLDRDRPLLMARPERHFLYEVDDAPPIVEALLVPFRIAGEPVGTVWVIAHDEASRFEPEDERLLTSLAACAAAAYELNATREAAERSSVAKSSFLSTMSHELRNPLNAIQGYADLLHDGVLGDVTDRQRDALRRTKKTARHLVEIIDEILVFARADSGGDEPRLGEVDLGEVVRDVAAIYEGRAERKRLALEIAGADDPVTVVSEEGKLRHILSNLVGNAVKYTGAGTVQIELEEDGDHARVHVRDTGPGIPADRHEDVFEPFERVETFTDRDPQSGTGLGLAIARTMARAVGGDVNLESTLGEGSVFTLRVPRDGTGAGEGTAASSVEGP